MENFDSNKKAEYDRMRQQKQDEANKLKRYHTIKRSFLWVAVLIFIAGSVAGLAKMISKSAPPASQPGALVAPVSSTDWVRGAKQSKVVLIEYADFQCPACGAYYPLVHQLYQEFGGQIQIVFRNFPLSQHQNARIAAQAAGAAGLQGKFWEMQDKIFENQQAWSELPNARNTLVQYAQPLGLNMDQFQKDIDSGKVKDKIDADYQSGIASGVDSTPTFYLNGTRIQPQSYDEFKNFITQALQKNS